MQITWCRKLHQLTLTMREHVISTKQLKGIALIKSLRSPASGKAGGKLPAAAFFTKTHFDIFGEFFPVTLPDLPSAVALHADLYLYANITMTFRPSPEVVNDSHGATASWPQVWNQKLDTLTR